MNKLIDNFKKDLQKAEENARQSFQPKLNSFCKKYNLNFVCGNGSWAFFNKNKVSVDQDRPLIKGRSEYMIYDKTRRNTTFWNELYSVNDSLNEIVNECGVYMNDFKLNIK